tara:strand:- start:145 stop:372 length:228 start_codon:yes stop_codon:yes gene_type:complete
MKQITIKLVKSPATYIVAWFILIFALASILSSCATGYVGCDAYGQNTIESIDSLDVQALYTEYGIDVEDIEATIE